MEDALALMERLSSKIFKYKFNERTQRLIVELSSSMYDDRDKKKKELEKFMKKKYRPIHFKKHGKSPF
jgi:hypothetical protein